MFCDYTGGFLAGFFSTLVGHPLDTIKTQQQLRNIGIFNAAHRIYKHRGPLGFYRGLSVPLIGQGLLNSVFFGVYGDIKDVLQKGQGKSTKGETSFSVIFWAGTIAGTATLPIIGPVELIKTKLQSQMKRKQFAGPKDCLQIVLRDGGVKGLCRGMLPLFWRDGVGGGAYFMGYEAMKAPIERMFPNSPMLKGIMAGGLAGLTNWALFLPFDTIKTRLQADDTKKPHYKNMTQVAREIVVQNGFIGFYRGILSVWTRAFPVNASIFMTIELMDEYVCKKFKTE